MRSKGSRFTLGVWGLRVCSLDVAFVAATVRNRPQPFVRSPYGRAYGKFCRGGQVWRFPTFRCFVSRGRRGTSCHSDVFCNVLKVVLCGKRNTFATFSDDVLQLSWQAQHFGRVVLSVFLQIALAGLRQVATRCKFRGRCGICDMCWKLTEASHETSILRLQNLVAPTKTRRKTLILKLQSVKIGGSLARYARFGAPTCLVSRLWFSLWRRRVYGGSSALHTLHFGLHTPHSSLENLHSSLYTLHFTLYTPHSTLYTPHSTLYTLYTPHSTLYTSHSLLYTSHSTLYTFHSTLQTGNRGNMYKTVQISYCRKALCVTAYPCVATSSLWAFGIQQLFSILWLLAPKRSVDGEQDAGPRLRRERLSPSLPTLLPKASSLSSEAGAAWAESRERRPSKQVTCTAWFQ